MARVVTKKDDEEQILRRFIENRGESFFSSLVDPTKSEPCDLAYNGVQYQVTKGDQDSLAKTKQDIQQYGHYLVIRGVADSNNPTEIIEKPLQKKMRKSHDTVVLLVDCTTSADFPQHEREKVFKDYFAKNKTLRGSWKEIFLVFRDQNIQLTS